MSSEAWEKLTWQERIDRARQSENGFTAHDVRLASDWMACSCGEHNGRIPRDGLNRPLDLVLRQLGYDFYDAVREGEFDEAEALLKEIEERLDETLT